MNILVLNTVNKSIQAFLATAPATTQPDFTSHYADATATDFTEASHDGVLNSTTPVTIVAAPATSTRRVVREITIYNADTAPITLTVRLNNSSNYRIIVKKTLAVGESWKFSDGSGGGGGGGGVEEAPVDGILYSRKNVGWVASPGAGVTDHGALTGLSDDDHTQYIKHALATAIYDFLVASGAGTFVKMTLADVKSLLGVNVIVSAYTSGARVYNNADIALVADTPKILTFNTERYDTEGIHSTTSNTSRLTCITPGVYDIKGNAQFQMVNSNYIYLHILLNNTTIIASKQVPHENVAALDIEVSTTYDLVAGDYVELVAYAYTHSLNIIYKAVYSPAFMMQRIG
jgi:hypothetical protein